jgi:HEAT repeat protein
MSPEITALVQQLQHPRADKRIEAAHQLGQRRELAPATVPYLIPLLQDANPQVRISASQAFQKMQESASAAISHLIPLLKDPHVEVRIWVPYALGEMGELAIDAVPDLKAMQQDANVDIAVSAATALTRIDRETRTATLTSFIQAMQDKDPQVRSQAAFGLKLMGRFAQDAIPQLQVLRRDPRSEVQREAAAVLAAIAIDAKIAIPDPVMPLR